jgi:hypothetical protein
LIIKGGVLEGRVITPEEVRRLADLESREVLLAKVAGGMQGILQQAISLISAPLSQAARLIAALEQAAAENPSLLSAGDTTAEPTNADLGAADDTTEPTNADLGAADDTTEPTNAELAAADDTTEPTNAELAATEDTSEPSNEELAVSTATAAPAAPSTDTPPRKPRQHLLRKTSRKGRPLWRSSAPPSSLTPSRSSP